MFQRARRLDYFPEYCSTFLREARPIIVQSCIISYALFCHVFDYGDNWCSSSNKSCLLLLFALRLQRIVSDVII